LQRIISFSGWGHKHDSLKDICKDSYHFNYLEHQSFKDVQNHFKSNEFDIVIGWSLGGQIALRLLDDDNITAKKLILIATPYQFVSDSNFKYGIDKATYNSFKKGFKILPKKTLDKFYFLNCKGANNHKFILNYLQKNKLDQLNNLSYWLEELGDFHCSDLDFSKINETELIYGSNDNLVGAMHAKLLADNIKNSNIHILQECGHVPHLSNLSSVKDIIK
jgi:pimeloyl-ACP methyl ester carboxylesterase